MASLAVAGSTTPGDCVCDECLDFRREYRHLLSLVDNYERRPKTARSLGHAANSLYDAWIVNQQHRDHVLRAALPDEYDEMMDAPDMQTQPLYATNPPPCYVCHAINENRCELADSMLNGTRLPYFSAEYLDAWQLREQHEEDHCFETAPQTLSEAETDLSDGDETDKTEESSHLSAELHGVEHGSKVVSVVKSDEPQDAVELQPAEEDRYDGVFMVCDHCHAHALPCNEASVCDQCRLHNQACVHRWCRDSSESKAACQNPDCPYVHEDSMPATDRDPGYLVLDGRLVPYMARGRIPARSTKRLNRTTDVIERMIMLNARQRQGCAAIQAAVSGGLGTTNNLSLNCDCQPLEMAPM